MKNPALRVSLLANLPLCAFYYIVGITLTLYEYLPESWQAGIARFVASPEAIRPLRGVLGVLLGLLFVAVGSAMLYAVQGTWSSMLHSDWLVRLNERIRDLESRSPIPASLPADAERLRSDLRAEIAAIEARLRGEWRFVAALIPAVLLGTVAVFVALLRWLK